MGQLNLAKSRKRLKNSTAKQTRKPKESNNIRKKVVGMWARLGLSSTLGYIVCVHVASYLGHDVDLLPSGVMADV